MDEKIASLRPLDAALPRGGWVKSIRESLGMSAEQLGNRLGGISKQAVLNLERNEVRRSASLLSLERAAAALGCRLVYAIVPETSLEALLDSQASLAAHRSLDRTRHSMALEAQEPPAGTNERQRQELADELKARLDPALWKSR
jgi:predicted DNA-binding mobile mystery protein A